MNITKYFTIVGLAFLFMTIAEHTLANQLTAQVDRDTIGLQETFTLTVSADAQTRSQPDFSALKNDFEILNSSNSRNISVINGRAESKVEWRLILAPKRIGTLLIPSFTLDNAISDAIEIRVSKQSQTQAGNDEQVRVVVETSKQTAFVQEQILVKIKLISQVNLNQAEMQPFDIKNAVVTQLNEKPTQYLTNINGRQHLIIEHNYAVFPQESGELVIPSVIYSVVPNADRDIWNDPFGRNRNNLLRIPTDEQRITVKATPNEMANKAWLPASNITLHETWSASLHQLKVGEPVTRTITITADGLTGGQITPLPSIDVKGLTFYPDQPQNNDNKTDKGIVGTRIETTAIIPNHGGDFTLPEVTLEWWDTTSNTRKTATLPAKQIHVLGEAAPTPIPEKIEAAPSTHTPPETITVTQPNYWYWSITALLAVLCAGLAFYVWKLKAQLAQWRDEKTAEDFAISEKEKDIWDLLKHASINKDAPALRKAVISWAKFQWPQAQIHSLDDVAKLGNKLELSQALKQLDAQLYSNHNHSDWDAQHLLQLLNECRKEKKTNKKNDGLKPLYR